VSGIVGIVHADGRPADPELLDRMSAAVAHRGPDRAGRWIDGPAALGHRLLATTRGALAERAPVADPSGTCRLVWDGRLDNREELGALLPGGAAAPGATDAALVLGAYRRWGAACVERLLGDFAFALWDAPARSLLCARDRIGVRPLHYTWDGRTLRVASAIAPLLAGAERPAEPDDEMVLAFLLREFRPEDHGRTFVRDVHRLPPGHALVVRDGGLRRWRYWAPDPAREIRYARDEEYVEHFTALFERAVADRLRTDWPVGALLSGGLDSSAIVCAAARLFDARGDGSPPLEAFTLWAEERGADEREWARAVTRPTGIKGHEIGAPPPAPLDGLDDHIGAAEGPIADPDNRATRTLYEAVAAAGCRVVLSGEGGDQVVDELGGFADLLRTLRPLRFAREVRAFGRWYGGGARDVALDAVKTLLPAPVKYWGKRLVRGVPPPWISRERARAVGLRARVRAPRHAVPCASRAQWSTYLYVTSPWYVLKLELEERIAARAGLEMRYPLLDSRLVEFVLAIPWERRTRGGARKWLLREAARASVPGPVLERRGKGDWTDPMDRSLRDLCREVIPAALEDPSRRLARYLDIPGARRFVAGYLAGDSDRRWDVWFLLTLDRWLERIAKGVER